MYSHNLDVPHLNDTHLKWQSGAPLAPQRVIDPHSPLGAWSTDIGHLGGLWNFGSFSILFGPSSLEAYSQSSVLRSFFFLASNRHSTASSSGSSLWAAAQSVTCISTRTHPAATCTSFSFSWSPSTTVRVNRTRVVPKVAPSRTDCTAFGPRQVVIQLSMSATVLSCPFWYSSWKLNFARAQTHRCPVASKFGVVIIYVKGLLSILTKRGWNNKVSLKCSMMAHFNARNSSLFK